MASATSTLRVVSPPPAPTPPKREEGEVVLRLTGPEARTLRTILRRVGGDPATTARSYADSITNALYKAGINHVTDIEGSGLYLTEQHKAEVEKVPEPSKLQSNPYQNCQGSAFNPYRVPYGSY